MYEKGIKPRRGALDLSESVVFQTLLRTYHTAKILLDFRAKGGQAGIFEVLLAVMKGFSTRGINPVTRKRVRR